MAIIKSNWSGKKELVYKIQHSFYFVRQNKFNFRRYVNLGSIKNELVKITEGIFRTCPMYIFYLPRN